MENLETLVSQDREIIDENIAIVPVKTNESFILKWK